MTVTATPVPLLSLSLVPWPVDQSCGHLFFKIVNYQRYFPASIPSVTYLGEMKQQEEQFPFFHFFNSLNFDGICKCQ